MRAAGRSASPALDPRDSTPACLPTYKSTISCPRPTSLSGVLVPKRSRMTMPYETILIVVLALPFAGSCLAAFLQSNARNAEAWLAGAISLICLMLLVVSYPHIVNGGVIPTYRRMGARTRSQFLSEDGRLRLGARCTDRQHRVPRGALRPLLLVPPRSRAALFFIPARLHGSDARHRPLWQPDPIGFLLGVDQPLFLSADRLLVPDSTGAGRRAWL